MKNYKMPYYVFYKSVLDENYNKLYKEFTDRYKDVIIAYSFKTNTHYSVCKEVRRLGCYAEVVSEYEYNKAVKLGFKEDKIIYNGVLKNVQQVKKCLKKGGIVNVENFSEFSKFYKEGIRKFGLRITFDINNDVTSRFGFLVGSDDYKRILSLHKSGEIKICGLHTHFSNGRYIDFWKKKVAGMLSCIDDFGYQNIEYLDFGGNMFSELPNEIRERYGDTPSFKDYAECICIPIKKKYTEKDFKMPKIIIEPGTPIVANAFSLICNVLYCKKNGNKEFVCINASQFDLGAISFVDNCSFKIIKSRNENMKKRMVCIVGNTCMEDDFIKTQMFTDIQEGDVIEFLNCGAYSYNWANDFITPRAKVVVK